MRFVQAFIPKLSNDIFRIMIIANHAASLVASFAAMLVLKRFTLPAWIHPWMTRMLNIWKVNGSVESVRASAIM